jgi:hypothetical protein
MNPFAFYESPNIYKKWLFLIPSDPSKSLIGINERLEIFTIGRELRDVFILKGWVGEGVGVGG